MFYKMIEAKRNEWLASDDCTVRGDIAYIERTGQMRDAQIDAIKTYLFLKIACGAKPLADLFRQGAFNTLSLDDIELSFKVREYLANNPAAAALLEYALLTNGDGEQVSPKLEQQIKKNPESIDYEQVFTDTFYGVSYTDYLFSLPMGAGKTYLMAAFIYLDLYYANQEPNNPAFAHNFIVFAPSGLKSSVVPSLKTIQKFDPSWVIPEPAASALKRQISFEVLDQGKTANKSNKTKNPNVQKIANHQPLSELFGLVAVTNAEKVILDRIQEKNGQLSFFDESDDDKDRQANELRNLIGKLPGLANNFFDLGNLFKDSFSSEIISGPHLTGSSDEKRKYWKIIELHKVIVKALSWGPIERAYDQKMCIRLAVQNCGKAVDEDVEISMTIPKDALLTTEEFPELKDDSVEYLVTSCDMDELFGIVGTAEYEEFSASQKSAPSYHSQRPNVLPGFRSNYRKDYIEELNDVFHYARYDNGANYTLKLKVDYIKHHTSVAFPTILLLKGEVSEIPYSITSKNNPSIVEGVLNVRKTL